MQTPMVSVVFPVYDEEDNLHELHRRVSAVCGDLGVTYELVFVDNGSRDGSLHILKTLAAADEHVRWLSLSRNFGHQGGLFAGICHARGRAVITMDADLQHPPEMIPRMLELWRQGYEVVYTTKKEHQLSPWLGWQVRWFYLIISKLSGLDLSFGQSDFRLLDQKVVAAITQLKDQRKFLRGDVQWVGFKRTGITYDVAPRHAGRSKFSYRSLLSFAADGILSHSILPLRLIFLLGVVIAGLSLLYTVVAVTVGFLRVFGMVDLAPPGWSAIAVSVTFLGGVQLLAVGVLGEYVGRVFEQGKGRPTFIIKETSMDQARGGEDRP